MSFYAASEGGSENYRKNIKKQTEEHAYIESNVNADQEYIHLMATEASLFMLYTSGGKIRIPSARVYYPNKH